MSSPIKFPPIGSMSFVLMLVSGVIIAVLVATLMGLVGKYMVQDYNNITVNLANSTGQSLVEYKSGNVTLYYINGSYNNAQNVFATTFTYTLMVFTSPVTLSILIGITLVVIALFYYKNS